jgi:hypothetical protein
MARYLSAVFVVLCSTSAFPGDEASIAVGSRVRVSAPGAGSQPVIGTVVGLEPNAVVVQAGDGAPSRIPLGAPTLIEVSGGRRSHAARGAMIGAAAGVLPGLLMTFGDYNSDPELSPGAVAAVGAAAGAAVGAAVGWAIKAERWLPASAPSVTAGVVPARGGFGVAVRLAWGGRRRQ